MLARLWALAQKTPPPPPRLPQLPTARGYPVRTLSGRLLYRVPHPPRKPPALAEAQARAARLARPRSPRLERPRLHVDHDHPRLPVFRELVSSYVQGEAPNLWLLAPSPWERWVIGHQLAQLDARIGRHKWGHLLRLDEVRRRLDLPGADRPSW